AAAAVTAVTGYVLPPGGPVPVLTREFLDDRRPIPPEGGLPVVTARRGPLPVVAAPPRVDAVRRCLPGAPSWPACLAFLAPGSSAAPLLPPPRVDRLAGALDVDLRLAPGTAGHLLVDLFEADGTVRHLVARPVLNGGPVRLDAALGPGAPQALLVHLLPAPLWPRPRPRREPTGRYVADLARALASLPAGSARSRLVPLGGP
ncbi:MAG: hypothetical protein KDG89_13985, partial [Geminicoccaceae bacterium]|nr:hypothetical protein [Geminicoccaceae bacterium]